MTESIWGRNHILPPFPNLEGNLKTDVLIVGGGLAGLLCAWQLKREGVDCVLMEAHRICGGTSRNTTAKITAQHGLIYSRLSKEFGPGVAAQYYRANSLALEKIREAASEADCDLEAKDNYVYASESAAVLEKEWDTLAALDIPAEYCADADIPIPVLGAIRFPDQAQLHPLKFAAHISKGLPIYEGTAAKEFTPNQVMTDRGTIQASKIIIATHFPILNKHGGYFLKLYQERSYVLALEGAKPVEGMYLGAEKTGFSFRQQGKYLLLGGGGHRTGAKGRGWQPLYDLARQHYPEATVTARWATQDCMTLDGMPYIGPYSKSTPDLFVATGFNKWGMTGAMLSAMVLSDLVQGRENKFAELVSPQRSWMHKQLAVNGLESCKNLLTLTTPRCPHLGCALKWNPWEHSWDCPCHGSRFDEKGTLLAGPATADLPNSGKT